MIISVQFSPDTLIVKKKKKEKRKKEEHTQEVVIFMLLLANLHLKLLMLSQSVTSNQVPNVHHI